MEIKFLNNIADNKYVRSAIEITRKVVHSRTLAVSILLGIKILFQVIILSTGYKWLSSDDFCRTVKAYEWLKEPLIYSGVWLSPHFWLNGFVMIFIKDMYAAATFTNVLFSSLTLIYFFNLADIAFDRKTAVISSLVFIFFPFQVWLSLSGLPESVFFFFALAGIYYFILWYNRKHSYYYLIIAAVCFALGNMFRYEAWLFSIVFVLLTAFEMFRDRRFEWKKLVPVAVSLISVITVVWWLILNLSDHGDMFFFARETNKIYEDYGAAYILQRVVQYPVFIFYIAPFTSFFAIKVVWKVVSRFFGNKNGNSWFLKYFIIFNVVQLLLLMLQGLLGTGGTNMISRYIVLNAILFVPPAVKQIFEFRKYLSVMLFISVVIGNVIWSFYYPHPFRQDTYETGRMLRGSIERNFIREDDKIYFEEIEGYYDVYAVQTLSNNPSKFVLGSLPAIKKEESKKKGRKISLSPEEINILDIKKYFEKNKVAMAVIKSDGYYDKLRKMGFKNEDIGDYKIFYIKDIETDISDSTIKLFSEYIIDLKQNTDIINFNKTLAVKDIVVDNTNFGFNPQTVTIDWASVNKGIIDSIDYDDFDFNRYQSVIELREEETDSLVHVEKRRIFSDRNIEDLLNYNEVRTITVLKPFALIYYSRRYISSPFESGVYNMTLKVYDSKTKRELPVFRGSSLMKKEEVRSDTLTAKITDTLKVKQRASAPLKDSVSYSYELGSIIAFFPNTNINKVVTKGGTSFYRIITQNGLRVFFSQRYQADHFLNYVFNYF